MTRRVVTLKRKARTISGRAVEIKRNEKTAELARLLGWRVRKLKGARS